MKKHLTLLLLTASLILGTVSAQLITAPQTPPAQRIAAELCTELNGEFDRRVSMHRLLFGKFWRNAEATPDAIAAALGTQAARLFLISAENSNHIDRLAEQLGKDVSDYIPNEDRIPPRTVTLNANGTVTIAP